MIRSIQKVNNLFRFTIKRSQIKFSEDTWKKREEAAEKEFAMREDQKHLKDLKNKI